MDRHGPQVKFENKYHSGSLICIVHTAEVIEMRGKVDWEAWGADSLIVFSDDLDDKFTELLWQLHE